MVVYLTNAFGISMLGGQNGLVAFNKYDDVQEFCTDLKKYANENKLVNAIGHESMVMLINGLCGTDFKTNRIEVKLRERDVLLIVSLGVRLPEGKVLNLEEMKALFNEGKVVLYKARIL